MPFVACVGASTLQPIRVVLPKLQTPLADGLMGHVDAALEQEFLHVAVAQREAIIQPDAMANDFPRAALVLVAFGGSGWRHVGGLSWVSLVCEGASRRSLCHGLGRRVNNLTMPASCRAVPLQPQPLGPARNQISSGAPW